MKIKAGEWYRYADQESDGMGRIWRADYDTESQANVVRVIVRDAKPRRTIKPSEALAWLMKQPGWGFSGSEDRRGPGYTFGVYCNARNGLVYGPTLTKAIIALRKAMGVR